MVWMNSGFFFFMGQSPPAAVLTSQADQNTAVGLCRLENNSEEPSDKTIRAGVHSLHHNLLDQDGDPVVRTTHTPF